MTSLAPASSHIRPPLAELRAEKQRHIAAFNQQKRQQQLAFADYIEAHPRSLEIARQHTARFLASPSHSRLHWILARWQQRLTAATTASIVAIFRDDSPDTQDLRDCPPYFGPTQ